MEIIGCYYKVANAYQVISLEELEFFTPTLSRRDSYSYQSPTPTR